MAKPISLQLDLLEESLLQNAVAFYVTEHRKQGLEPDCLAVLERLADRISTEKLAGVARVANAANGCWNCASNPTAAHSHPCCECREYSRFRAA